MLLHSTKNIFFEKTYCVKTTRKSNNQINSGTELSKSGVLSLSDSGRGDKVRRKKLSDDLCSVDEASKKKG